MQGTCETDSPIRPGHEGPAFLKLSHARYEKDKGPKCPSLNVHKPNRLLNDTIRLVTKSSHDKIQFFKVCLWSQAANIPPFTLFYLPILAQKFFFSFRKLDMHKL